MAVRNLRCRIEEVADWYPELFLEPYLVACVAALSRYSGSPAFCTVDCESIDSPRLAGVARLRLQVSWTKQTAEKAERLRATMPATEVVELAAVALAFVLTRRVLRLKQLVVTRNRFMLKTKARPYSRSLLERMEETSGIILKARALVAMGMPKLALSAWLAAAAGEEQVAPRLETLDRDEEAAVHRISAASCYQHAGELGKAINLYRAALTGPLPEHTRKETQQLLAACRAQFARAENGTRSD